MLCKIISHVLYVYQQKLYCLLTIYQVYLVHYVLGVTQEMYRRMAREEGQFDWQCTLCSIPNVAAPDNQLVANNTDVEDPDNPPANDTDAQEADYPLNNTSFNVSRSFIQPERIDER